MADEYYRGGNDLKPRRGEVAIDRGTGLLKPLRGVSVYNRPDNLEKLGGAHRLVNVPAERKIVQRGRDPTHFEVIPAFPMTLKEYEDALARITLVPV